eukprot:FR738552.1.p1 GENE.FR738552.1~~FR738552.1.p1  ORF type:complete len:116 (-),score=29.62 FR738552.1:163-510(-)
MTMITPSAQLTLTKGNKSWSSTAVAAALELVDPLGSGPWLSPCGRFFFFFFFFLKASSLVSTSHKVRKHERGQRREHGEDRGKESRRENSGTSLEFRQHFLQEIQSCLRDVNLRK